MALWSIERLRLIYNTFDISLLWSFYIAEVKQRWSVIGWVTKKLLSQAISIAICRVIGALPNELQADTVYFLVI
jgi:hypothetical protein